VIAGDERARFGATIAVLDDLRAAGITQFTVETRTRKTGQ
jgi:biopolymer transport protein ExbD